MRTIDADALIQKRCQAKDFHPDMYVIGQGYVMDAPTIEAKRGLWKRSHDHELHCRCWECTNCHEVWTQDFGSEPVKMDWKFCPSCGAIMDAEGGAE